MIFKFIIKAEQLSIIKKWCKKYAPNFNCVEFLDWYYDRIKSSSEGSIFLINNKHLASLFRLTWVDDIIEYEVVNKIFEPDNISYALHNGYTIIEHRDGSITYEKGTDKIVNEILKSFEHVKI
jgi:hypothetical protein